MDARISITRNMDHAYLFRSNWTMPFMWQEFIISGMTDRYALEQYEAMIDLF